MNKTLTRIAGSIAGLTLAVTGVAASPSSAAPVAPQGIVPALSINDGVFKNAGRKTFNICENWGTTSCAKGSDIHILRPGEVSSMYWVDTDGFQLPPGYKAVVGIFVYGCNTSSSSKWKKLYGTAGITMPITMGKC